MTTSEGTLAEVLAGDARWCVICADSLDVLPTMADGCVDSVVTDPVWPNAPDGMFPGVDPDDVWARACPEIARVTSRLVVVLGCTSDPRFLSAVPLSLPFVRPCWLRRTPPSYLGTVLGSADVAYVFGHHRPPPGKSVMPGEMQAPSTVSARDERAANGHPCPRGVDMMEWIIRWFGGDLILDLFAGSGTTGVAALRLGRRVVLIEREQRWADLSRERLRAEEENTTLAAVRAGQMALFGGGE